MLTTDAHTEKNSSYISSLRDEIEYLTENNREKPLIIKQLTEIRSTVNHTSTLVTCNGNSTDRTRQNSNNLIHNTIQNDNFEKKELLKNKENASKSFSSTKTLSTMDNFTSTCFEHPVNKKIASTTGKISRKLVKKKESKRKQKKKRIIVNKKKRSVHVLGDSIVKKCNGFLLTKKNRHKHLVKVRSFAGVEISCMTDHVKSTLRDINPNHIVLNPSTNVLRTEKADSQTEKVIIDLGTSLKNNGNTITASGIVPCLDELNNKDDEVYRHLVLMCQERNISFFFTL